MGRPATGGRGSVPDLGSRPRRVWIEAGRDIGGVSPDGVHVGVPWFILATGQGRDREVHGPNVRDDRARVIGLVERPSLAIPMASP